MSEKNAIVFKLHDPRAILVEQNTTIIGVIVKASNVKFCIVDLCDRSVEWYDDIGECYELFNDSYTENPVP